MRRLRTGYLGLVLMAGMGVSAVAAPLQPFQLVRCLQIVQDRIAAGDDAALPMQQKLLGIIDQQMRDTDPAIFDDKRNLQALIVYGLSGGNPRTLELLLSRLQLDGAATELGEAVLHYANGDTGAAHDILGVIDPRSMPASIGAPAALVAATVTASKTPAVAVRFLDDARLLSPGTLIEEAALRRSIPLAARLKDRDRFISAAGQYARRFLGSPYAGQFADAFVAATVTLHETLDFGEIEHIVAMMNTEQAQVIYLRLARKSAIEGFERLHAFASEKAQTVAADEAPGADPRAMLYARVAEVTSENVDDVLAALNKINAARLSASDRELLDAAKFIAEAVLDGPSEVSVNIGASEVPEAQLPELETYLRKRLDQLQAIDALLTEGAQ